MSTHLCFNLKSYCYFTVNNSSKVNGAEHYKLAGPSSASAGPKYFMAPGPSEQSISSWNKIFAGPGPPTSPTPLSTVLQVSKAMVICNIAEILLNI